MGQTIRLRSFIRSLTLKDSFFEEATTHAVFFFLSTRTRGSCQRSCNRLENKDKPLIGERYATTSTDYCLNITIHSNTFHSNHSMRFFHSIRLALIRKHEGKNVNLVKNAITNVPTALETWPLSQAEGRWNNCMEWFGIKWIFCVSIFPNLIGSFDRSFVRSFTKQSTKIVIFYAPWQLRSLQLLMELHICVAQWEKNLCRCYYFHTIRAHDRLWK